MLISAVAYRWYQKGYKPVVFFFLGSTHGGDLENRDRSNYDNISSLSRYCIFFSHTIIFFKLKQLKEQNHIYSGNTSRHFYNISGNIIHYLIFGFFFSVPNRTVIFLTHLWITSHALLQIYRTHKRYTTSVFL